MFICGLLGRNYQYHESPFSWWEGFSKKQKKDPETKGKRCGAINDEVN